MLWDKQKETKKKRVASKPAIAIGLCSGTPANNAPPRKKPKEKRFSEQPNRPWATRRCILLPHKSKKENEKKANLSKGKYNGNQHKNKHVLPRYFCCSHQFPTSPKVQNKKKIKANQLDWKCSRMVLVVLGLVFVTPLLHSTKTQFISLNNISSTTTSPIPICTTDTDCSLQGKCVEGVCLCDQGWKGPTCKQPLSHCINECSGHGSCVDGSSPPPLPSPSSIFLTPLPLHFSDWCQCDYGWEGLGCDSSIPCPHNCNNHGNCVGGVCECEVGWKSPASYCDTDTCPNHCRFGRVLIFLIFYFQFWLLFFVLFTFSLLVYLLSLSFLFLFISPSLLFFYIPSLLFPSLSVTFFFLTQSPFFSFHFHWLT